MKQLCLLMVATPLPSTGEAAAGDGFVCCCMLQQQQQCLLLFTLQPNLCVPTQLYTSICTIITCIVELCLLPCLHDCLIQSSQRCCCPAVTTA